ncbi:uncharacterized protein A4U43_C03F26040 [Asparagus officinalis]|uniref:MgsA AAA+ ATPase C-terminal domain-containing protein n=1 Tax=Asparagus officinalis TaxID=4686 RepID=A0A5P1FD43_ASPOF|nr:uncharacterized protein A4U43_C03F26040 [Asparagus officinalis]
MSIDDDAIGFLSTRCDGDARVALNALETASTLAVNRGSTNITIDHVKDSMQCKHLAYDKDGEEHYNLISALHKSMRGNDANAAIYWTPLRLARPWPATRCECDVNLAQCVAYLAMAPKSVAVYKALGEARRTVRESGGGNAGVPLHLRNAPTRLMKELGYGEGYVYTPEDPEGSKLQSYLPPELQGRRFLQWSPVKEKGTD